MNASFEYLAGIVLVVLGVTYGRAVFRVLGFRLRSDLPGERVEPGDVPDEVRAVLEARSGELTELGFEPLGFVRRLSVFGGVDRPAFARVFQHPAEQSFAVLELAGSSRSRPCEVTFHAQADEGRRVETQGWPLMEQHLACPKHVMIDAHTVSLAEQWERHRREVAARPDFAPRDISVDELLVELRGSWKCMTTGGIERGQFAPAGDGLVRFRLRHAIATVVTSTREEKRRRAALAKRDKALRAQGAVAPTAAPELARHDVTAELVAHQRREDAERSRSSGWALKLGLFAASVGVAAVAFGMSLNLETLAILLGVLFVHELGHALAMKAFGYRNLQILFVPFFGAVASGRKRDVPAWQEIVVLLAGPVPGIVVGTALYLTLDPAASPLLANVAWSMLILNYFNLLPIVPLDGGRILNIALFDRLPNLQLGFAAASGLALYALGTATQATVMRFLGLGMLLGIPAQWKNTRLLAGARRRMSAPGAAPEPPDALRALYTELQQPKFDSLNSESKYELASSLIDRLMRRPAGAGLAAASIVGWLVIMVLPLGVVTYKEASRGALVAAKADAERQQRVASWTAKITAATAPRDEVQARVDAAADLYEHMDPAEARRALEPALALSRTARDPALESSAQLWMARLELGPLDGDEPSDDARARAERHLLRALDLREQRYGMDSLEVAEVLEAWPEDSATDRVAALVRSLRLVEIYEHAASPEVAGQLVHAYEREARLRDERGDADRAEAALKQGLATAEAAERTAHDSLDDAARGELAAFYFTHGRYDDVRPLVKSGSADACWLAYWEEQADAPSCFAGLRSKVATATSPRGNWRQIELAVDEAAARVRAGDTAAARPLAAQASAAYGSLLDGADLAGFLRSAAEPRPGAGFRERESNRRAAERARAVAPLLATVADAQE